MNSPRFCDQIQVRMTSMVTFLSFVILFFMFFPALLAVALAPRSPLAFIWNMGWFYLMALISERAFENPEAKWIGLSFAVIYVVRAMTRKENTSFVQFHTKSFGHTRYGQHTRRPSPAEPIRTSDEGIIDVEAIRESPRSPDIQS